jgi:hypothetical protein
MFEAFEQAHLIAKHHTHCSIVGDVFAQLLDDHKRRHSKALRQRLCQIELGRTSFG